jgi:hypothetical protein
MLTIEDAPTVKRIGPEFQAPSSSPDGDTVVATLAPPPFPKLRVLQLIGLCEWEEWEWNNDEGCEAEQQGSAKDTMTMPCLEKLTIDNCKLSHLPPGLASMKRHALRELNLYDLTNLTYVENFPSVVELDVFNCPKLKRISGLSRLHKIRIVRCPKLEVLEGVPSLDSLVLQDTTLEAVPGYLQTVNPRYLELKCRSSCANHYYHRVAPSRRRSAISENSISSAWKIEMQARWSIFNKMKLLYSIRAFR